MSTVAMLGVGFIVVWVVILGLYMRSSRQQEQLENALDDLEQKLDKLDVESADASG